MEKYHFVYDALEHPLKFRSSNLTNKGVEDYLKTVQSFFNDKLRVNGYVFLSEILEHLELGVTTFSQVVGWTLNGDGDGFIDFGITSSGYPCMFELDFNCDGCILDKFE